MEQICVYNLKLKMKVEKISELTTNRLSIYLRCLDELSKSGVKTISSEELAKRFHLNSAQIRKDLAYFGEFGIRGVGYYVNELRDHLKRILGLDRERRICIIGAGRLGTALADYNGLKKSNFSVVALFDTDKSKIGRTVGSAKIYDFVDFHEISKRKQVEIAVIAVPAVSAQKVLDEIVKAGIKAVLNFAPVPLVADNSVKVKTVDLTTSLESLSYFLSQSANGINQ